MGLTATRADGKGDAHLDLEATLLDDGQISSLNVVPVDQASKTWLDLVIEGKEPGSNDGPKWETFDGRVRQQIWQRTGLFEEGNTFIKDKLELTTGRIICIVDKTVWGLYEAQMRKWAQSVDLKIDPIIAPGNEDEKSMENMLFLLDELKRVDPHLRRCGVLAYAGASRRHQCLWRGHEGRARA